jgi:hypothetical protein
MSRASIRQPSEHCRRSASPAKRPPGPRLQWNDCVQGDVPICGRNTAKTLSEFVIHDSRKTA